MELRAKISTADLVVANISKISEVEKGTHVNLEKSKAKATEIEA